MILFYVILFYMLVFCDTCMTCVIHTCLLRSSFLDMHRCPLRVLAAQSLREISFELLKMFGQWIIMQFLPIIHTLYAIIL